MVEKREWSRLWKHAAQMVQLHCVYFRHLASVTAAVIEINVGTAHVALPLT